MVLVVTLVENIEHVEISAFLFGGRPRFIESWQSLSPFVITSPDHRSGVVISDIEIVPLCEDSRP